MWGRRRNNGDLGARLAEVLEEAEQRGGDPVAYLSRLVDLLRPPRRRPELAVVRQRSLDDLLAARPELGAVLRGLVLELFAGRDALPFYTEAGILPDRGFGEELRRRFLGSLLPELPDGRDLVPALRRVYRRARDPRWLERLPEEVLAGFWRGLQDAPAESDPRLVRIRARQADAARLLAYRCATWAEHTETRRLRPRAPHQDSPFLALAAAVDAWLAADRRDARVANAGAARARLLHCRAELEDLRWRAVQQGTSLALTLILQRLEQSLARLDLLLRLGEAEGTTESGALSQAWAHFMANALKDCLRRDSPRDYLRQATGLLALRVTENASRAGEHYIASKPGEMMAMARAALGGGAIIGVLALFKILLHHLDLAPAIQALAYGLNYGLGFVLIYLLGLTVATKQPAMTAATLAVAVEEALRAGRPGGRLRAMLAAVVRTQTVAILGNVALALPVALVVGGYLGVDGPVTPADADALLRELHPLDSPAIAHAAVAGVCLFLAGLISGYFDNVARYDRIGERITAHVWLRRLLGPRGAAWLGGAVDRHLGGIMGNLLFGLMLGGAGFIGFIFGLPLDIRHVAFASANLGYAVAGSGFDPDGRLLAWAGLGVASIALTNLLVSFVLALGVALRARGLGWRDLPRALGR